MGLYVVWLLNFQLLWPLRLELFSQIWQQYELLCNTLVLYYFSSLVMNFLMFKKIGIQTFESDFSPAIKKILLWTNWTKSCGFALEKTFISLLLTIFLSTYLFYIQSIQIRSTRFDNPNSIFEDTWVDESCFRNRKRRKRGVCPSIRKWLLSPVLFVPDGVAE